MSVEKHDYQPAWRSFYWHILLMAAVFIVACVISLMGSWGFKGQMILWLIVLVVLLGIFVHMATRRMGVVLSVRHDEVALDTGIFKRKSIEISYSSLRTVEVTQTILQRLLNLGDLSIASSGTGGYEIVVPNMPNPNAIRNEIQAHERGTVGAKAEGAQNA